MRKGILIPSKSVSRKASLATCGMRSGSIIQTTLRASKQARRHDPSPPIAIVFSKAPKRTHQPTARNRIPSYDAPKPKPCRVQVPRGGWTTDVENAFRETCIDEEGGQQRKTRVISDPDSTAQGLVLSKTDGEVRGQPIWASRSCGRRRCPLESASPCVACVAPRGAETGTPL